MHINYLLFIYFFGSYRFFCGLVESCRFVVYLDILLNVVKSLNFFLNNLCFLLNQCKMHINNPFFVGFFMDWWKGLMNVDVVDLGSW